MMGYFEEYIEVTCGSNRALAEAVTGAYRALMEDENPSTLVAKQNEQGNLRKAHSDVRSAIGVMLNGSQKERDWIKAGTSGYIEFIEKGVPVLVNHNIISDADGKYLIWKLKDPSPTDRLRNLLNAIDAKYKTTNSNLLGEIERLKNPGAIKGNENMTKTRPVNGKQIANMNGNVDGANVHNGDFGGNSAAAMEYYKAQYQQQQQQQQQQQETPELNAPASSGNDNSDSAGEAKPVSQKSGRRFKTHWISSDGVAHLTPKGKKVSDINKPSKGTVKSDQDLYNYYVEKISGADTGYSDEEIQKIAADCVKRIYGKTVKPTAAHSEKSTASREVSDESTGAAEVASSGAEEAADKATANAISKKFAELLDSKMKETGLTRPETNKKFGTELLRKATAEVKASGGMTRAMAFTDTNWSPELRQKANKALSAFVAKHKREGKTISRDEEIASIKRAIDSGDEKNMAKIDNAVAWFDKHRGGNAGAQASTGSVAKAEPTKPSGGNKMQVSQVSRKNSGGATVTSGHVSGPIDHENPEWQRLFNKKLDELNKKNAPNAEQRAMDHASQVMQERAVTQTASK